jgi:hypothetical protein
MLHVICATCGIDGILLADEGGEIPQCLQCGRPFQVTSPAERLSFRRAEPTEDLVASWVSGETVPFVRAPLAFDDFICRVCGYRGPAEKKDGWRYRSCPACGEFDRPPTKYPKPKALCPECELLFEISAHDRGKTVICPGCHCFLGCLMPVEHRRNRPFWSRG